MAKGESHAKTQAEGTHAKTPKEGSHAKTLRRKVRKKGIALLGLLWSTSIAVGEAEVSLQFKNLGVLAS